MRGVVPVDWKARADVLEQENQRLRDELEHFQQLLVLTPSVGSVPALFGLTPSEHYVLGALFRRVTLTRDAIHGLLYGGRNSDETPDPRIIDVFICKLRRKVKPLGIEIKTNRCEGFTLPPESRKRIAQVVSDWKRLQDEVLVPGA